MIGIMGRLKWFIIGLVIGSLVTYIFIGERLFEVREEIKQWFSLEMGAVYAEEVSVSRGASVIQRVGKREVETEQGERLELQVPCPPLLIP